jgi:hypothetical protein
MKRRAAHKRFDCVAFKQQAQSRVYEDTREMTVAEEVEYFRRRAQSGTLGSWWKRVLPSNVALHGNDRDLPQTTAASRRTRLSVSSG